MRIAIFGATSQIAKDLIRSFQNKGGQELVLFARRPEAVREWAEATRLSSGYLVKSFDEFDLGERFDAIFNFVGVGDPAQSAAMGASIFDITLKYDEMALSYLDGHPECRYFFLSSGAVFGTHLEAPIGPETKSMVAVNNVQPQDWYGVAKLHAECRHRAAARLPIIDIRVFNYFSHTQDLSARFFITDILRAILEKRVLKITSDFMMRDYLHPEDFHAFVEALLNSPAQNAAFDCFSRAPVDKITLLEEIRKAFGLQYEMVDPVARLNSTGAKPFYFSLNKSASACGYAPRFTSIEGVLRESEKVLKKSPFDSSRK